MIMPVSPMGGGNGGWGNGFMDNGWWLILVFLICGNNGFGFGNNGFGGGAGYVDNAVQRGFDQSATINAINGVQSTLASAEIAACNRAAASLERSFAAQTAVDGRLDSIAMALQNCCCENRAATADLKYTIATEAATTRAANQANTQAILDKLCQQEIDAKNETIANLRTQLNMANLAASQTAQTAQILADNARQTSALEQYLNPVPIPSFTVANPHCCNANFGCGCGA